MIRTKAIPIILRITSKIEIKPILEKFKNIDIKSVEKDGELSNEDKAILFFEFVYEVFREKIKLGEKKLEDKDLNLFFDNKLSQSEIVQKWSDSGIKKLKNCYVKLLAEAGLLSDTKGNREIIPALINYKVADELVKADMEVYLNAVKGV